MEIEYEEILPNMFFLPGIWPCCNRFLIKGSAHVLIDSGSDVASAALLAKTQSIDVLINTHFHFDHACCNWKFPGSKLWAHAAEVFEGDQKNTNPDFPWQESPGYAIFKEQFRPVPVAKTLVDHEIIDLGRLKLQVLHTPGHTPGHLSFWLPEDGIVFSGDITLNHFGPWYGCFSSSIDQFIDSIRRLRDLKPKRVYSGHGDGENNGCYTDHLEQCFTTFENKIHARDQRIYQALDRPQSLSDIFRRHLIYGTHINELLVPYENSMVLKHLQRLLEQGEILYEDKLYFQRSPKKLIVSDE